MRVAEIVGFPAIIRPSFTLGGTGAQEQLIIGKNMKVLYGGDWNAARFTRSLVEESVLGWKEYELEVMRDLGG